MRITASWVTLPAGSVVQNIAHETERGKRVQITLFHYFKDGYTSIVQGGQTINEFKNAVVEHH